MLSCPLGSLTGCSVACFYPKPPSFANNVSKNRFWFLASLTFLLIGCLLLYLPLSYLCSEEEWKFYPSFGPCWSEANPQYTTLGLVTGIVVGIGYGSAAVFLVLYLRAKSNADIKVITSNYDEKSSSDEESQNDIDNPSLSATSSASRSCNPDSDSSGSWFSKSRKSRRPLRIIGIGKEESHDQDMQSASSFSKSYNVEGSSSGDSSASSRNDRASHEEEELSASQKSKAYSAKSNRSKESRESSNESKDFSASQSSKSSASRKSKDSSSKSNKSKDSSRSKNSKYLSVSKKLELSSASNRNLQGSYLPESYKFIKLSSTRSQPESNQGLDSSSQASSRASSEASSRNINKQNHKVDGSRSVNSSASSSKYRTSHEEECSTSQKSKESRGCSNESKDFSASQGSKASSKKEQKPVSKSYKLIKLSPPARSQTSTESYETQKPRESSSNTKPKDQTTSFVHALNTSSMNVSPELYTGQEEATGTASHPSLSGNINNNALVYEQLEQKWAHKLEKRNESIEQSSRVGWASASSGREKDGMSYQGSTRTGLTTSQTSYCPDDGTLTVGSEAWTEYQC